MVLYGNSRFVVDVTGMRVERSRRHSWQVGWFELTGVWICSASRVHPGAFGATATLVRLEFAPLDQWRFAYEHPSLQRYHNRQNGYDVYCLSLGPGNETMQRVDGGLRDFAPGHYGGVVGAGNVSGLRYT